LTGKIKKPEDLPQDDFRLRTPRFQGDNFQRNLDLVERSWRDCSPEKMYAGTARARVGAGTRRRCCSDSRNKTPLRSMSILAMTNLARIEEVAPKDAFGGSRYPKAMLDLLNR